MIRVQQISKHFGAIEAVKAVSFSVQAGQTLCLIGSSGSGKTSTLKMLNRLIEADSGQIEIAGQSILKQDPVRLRRKMGYVIQQGGLFPHLTVFQNIALLLKLENWSAARQRQRVSELLSLVSLPENYTQRYPAALSGGERQRVGVARALALHPPILLMDEPFGALDPITRSQVQDGFLEIQRVFGVTTVMVTHDMAEAFKCGDTIALMDQGQLIQIGTPLELLNQPANAFVAEFVATQAGLDQILKLPVSKLAVPLSAFADNSPTKQQPWLIENGQLVGWRHGQNWLRETLPTISATTPIQTALKRLLSTNLPGLPISDASHVLQGFIMRADLERLL